MTTIAYRDGVIAADSQCDSGDFRDCTAIKVARNDRGDLCGAAGDLPTAQRVLAWFEAGEKGDEPRYRKEEANGEGFIVRRDGSIEIMDDGGHYTIKASYYATGSGRKFALGAMAAGATAEQAVEAAMKHDIYTGGEIVTHARDAE